jgi:hypothetical protein
MKEQLEIFFLADFSHLIKSKEPEPEKKEAIEREIELTKRFIIHD